MRVSTSRTAFAVAVLLALCGCGKLQDDRRMESAERRVRSLLDGTRQGGAGDQTAFTAWWSGRPASEDEMRSQVDRFETWRREKGLGGVREFTIDGVTLDGAGRERRAIVSATVDGRPLRVVVREGLPLE